MNDINALLKKLVELVNKNALGISSMRYSGDRNAFTAHDMKSNTVGGLGMSEVNFDVTFTGLGTNKEVAKLLTGFSDE